MPELLDHELGRIKLDTLPLYLYLRYYRLIIGIAGTLFFMALFEVLSHKIPRTKIGDTIIKWGASTLGIYIFQTLILELFLKTYINFDDYNVFLFNFLIVPAISLLVLVASLGVIRMVEKSRWTKFLLLGAPYPLSSPPRLEVTHR